MIYLATHNVIFLKPRKVAGTSMEIALSQFAGKSDIVTPISEEDEQTRRALGFTDAQNFQAKGIGLLSPRQLHKLLVTRRIPQVYFNHMSAALARSHLGRSTFDGAFKITMIRNPFEVLVSMYFWRWRDQDDKPGFAQWLRANPEVMNMNNQQYLIDGKDIIDFYVRLQSAADDLSRLEELRPDLKGVRDAFLNLSSKRYIRPINSAANELFSGHYDLITAVYETNHYTANKFGYTLE